VCLFWKVKLRKLKRVQKYFYQKNIHRIDAFSVLMAGYPTEYTRARLISAYQ